MDQIIAPSAEELARAPLIEDWRFVPLHGEVGVVVGYVTGHPSLGDAWIRTSLAVLIDRDGRRMRTASRWYRLGTEAPKGELPPGGQDRLLQLMLDAEMAAGGGAVQGQDRMEAAMRAAEEHY